MSVPSCCRILGSRDRWARILDSGIGALARKTPLDAWGIESYLIRAPDSGSAFGVVRAGSQMLRRSSGLLPGDRPGLPSLGPHTGRRSRTRR